MYLSLDRATATAELDSWYEYYSIPDTAFKPRLLAAVAVSVRSLLDLTSPEVLAYLGLSASHLGEEWRDVSDTGRTALTQTLGRLAYEVGFEGFIVRLSDEKAGSIWYSFLTITVMTRIP